MLRINVNGIPPYDGAYELDSNDPNFTNGELRAIKKETGIIASELGNAIVAGDQDAWVGVTMILLQRSGKFEVVLPQLLWDAPSSAITVEESEDEDEDEGASEDPNSQPPSVPPSETGDESDDDASRRTSGDGSGQSSGGQVVSLPPTGTQG